MPHWTMMRMAPPFSTIKGRGAHFQSYLHLCYPTLLCIYEILHHGDQVRRIDKDIAICKRLDRASDRSLAGGQICNTCKYIILYTIYTIEFFSFEFFSKLQHPSTFYFQDSSSNCSFPSPPVSIIKKALTILYYFTIDIF